MVSGCRWTRDDLRNKTGMVVIEMDIPTGYVVMNDRLREYVKSGAVPTLSRAEFYDRKVVFYLDYVSTSSLTNSCTVNCGQLQWILMASGP